jgi:hypothetical protein
VGIVALVVCWISYFAFKFADSSVGLVELIIGLLKDTALTLIAELKHPLRHPAITLESVLIVAFVLLIIIVAVLWLGFQLAEARGSTFFEVVEACIILVFIFIAINSASFAKHLL